MATVHSKPWENIGKTAIWYSDSPMYFEVEILDYRAAYGRDDYKIKPLSGGGETWASGVRLFIADCTNPENIPLLTRIIS
jgi:hypothetical protein